MIEPTANEGAGGTADQPPAQDEEREGDHPIISADNEEESGQHVDDQTTNAGTKGGGEEENQTDLEHPPKTEEGITLDTGEQEGITLDTREQEGITLDAGEQETHEEEHGAEPVTETRRPETEASKQETAQGDAKPDRPTTEHSHASNESGRSKKKGNDKSGESEKKETKKVKHKDKDKEKKQKKRSRQQSHSESPRTLRKRSTKSDARSRPGVGGNKQLEAILLSIFQPFDPDGNGYMESSVFWEVGG